MESTGISAAGNTYNPCLLVLRSKGYELWAEETEDHRMIWNARMGSHSLSGYSPPELLGIVALWEAFGAEWNRQQPNVLREITEKASE